ncbi:EamA family transporter [Nonomuraea sp. NPDC050663]|uniref:EamA family transporter n=1 Tax=Nonomuraea sp. NPDC050663 TaxID=3364370 RepID=UPI0037B953BB
MTVNALDRPFDDGKSRLPRLGSLARHAADAIPPSGLVMLGILSVQVGAAFAKELFAVLPPSAVVFLRIGAGALVMLLVARPKIKGLSWRDWAIGLTFGGTLALMNLSFYEALSRLPMGIAVAIEFLGPLGVAVAASRKRLDLLWVSLAAIGVVLMAPWQESASVSWVGIGFALVAGACWAAYILLSAAAGSRFPGTTGLTFAMVVSAVFIAPVGVTTGGADLLQPELLLIGLGVGLLSSVIPYSLELKALRRMPKHVFGVLMSLEPAAAAMIGLVVLGEILDLLHWAAIGCIIAASLGATRAGEKSG